MRDPFALSYEELPRELIVFPLPGALLLPYGRLPLNIFEPRYLAMVEDALANKRTFGMIQTKAPVGGLVPDGEPLYDVGCAGRIISFAETGDGRYVLTLEGMCRYRILREIEGRRGYRRVEADYAPFKNDLADDGWKLDREAFFATLKGYFEAQGIRTEWDNLQKADDHMLIATLGMMCPFDIKEKQALVEAPDFAGMSEIMRSLMEMATISSDQSSAKH